MFKTFIFIGMTVGVFLGLSPLICGIIKKKIGLGIAGFFACIVASAILNIISGAPVCALFIHLIFKKDNKNPDNSQHQD